MSGCMPWEALHAYRQGGLGAIRTVDEAQALTKALIAEPGYLDAKHPDHARLVTDTQWLYCALAAPEDGA